jgi:hypothetical protein
MFYIDDYNSKTITNSLPKKEREALAKVKSEMDSKQLATFWYIAGVTIASNYEEVRELLLKYGYDVTNEEDAAAAITDILGTPKWTKFVKEFEGIIEDTVDEKIDYLKNNEESGFEAREGKGTVRIVLAVLAVILIIGIIVVYKKLKK